MSERESTLLEYSRGRERKSACEDGKRVQSVCMCVSVYERERESRV